MEKSWINIFMKKHLYIYLILFIILIAYNSTADDSQSFNQINFFSDEKTAVEKLKVDPTEDNAKELAAIRFKYAIELYVYSKKNNDWDAFELALLYASSATKLNPAEWVYWLLLGKIYSEIEVEGVVLALDPLQNAIKLNPNSFEAQSLLGTCYSRIGEHVNAVIYLEKAAKINSKKLSKGLIQIMVHSYAKEPQLKRGIRFFKWMIKEKKASPYAKIALALLLRKSGKQSEAEKILEKVSKNEQSPVNDKKMAAYLLDLWTKGAKQ